MITSTKNPRLVAARKLKQRKHRLRQNRFLVEGLQLLAVAMQATTTSSSQPGVKPRQVFYSEDLFTGETAPRLLAQLTAAGAEAISVAPNVMNALSERDTSQGLIATFALSEVERSIDRLELVISPDPQNAQTSPPLDPPDYPPLLLILDKLQDPGNLGTLIRTADAVGVRAVILLEPCVDPFDPKTVRSTMGSIFTVPFAGTKNIDQFLPYLSKMGYYLVGADAKRGRSAWQSDALAGPVALVLGNEARGLSPELHRCLNDYVSLPLRGQAESLNVSIAGGVLMYEWLRVNTGRSQTMNKPSSLKFNPHVAAAPIYVSDRSSEAIQTEQELEDIIKIGSNESPLGPSPRAVEAIQQAATGLNRYPTMGDEDLRNVLAETIGQGMEPDNFFTGNGGCDVLSMIAASFLAPGNEAIICRPTFPVYDITARRVGANIVYAGLDPEQFSYDVEAILAALTERTRLIYICSPNNPTGSTISAEQMETLMNNTPPHVLIMADEVYYHFATTADFPDSLAYVREGKNVVILHSFSKGFGLAGLRLGYAIAPVEIARYFSRARQSFHLSQVALAGGIASLRDKAHLEKIVAVTLAGRDWLYEKLTALGMRVWPSQGNFILFKPPFPPAKLSDRLLRRGVVVRPMTQFYLPTHMRVTVGLPEENERFIAALRQSLAEMEAEGVSKEMAAEEGGKEFKF